MAIDWSAAALLPNACFLPEVCGGVLTLWTKLVDCDPQLSSGSLPLSCKCRPDTGVRKAWCRPCGPLVLPEPGLPHGALQVAGAWTWTFRG